MAYAEAVMHDRRVHAVVQVEIGFESVLSLSILNFDSKLPSNS